MPLLFGTGGIPLTTKNRSAVEGVRRIHELGLDAMELEFVYQVFLNKLQAQELREEAEKLNVALSVHGSYFINLASPDKQKWHASINRIIQAAEIGSMAGARYLTFHTAFRQKQEPADTYESIKEALNLVFDKVNVDNLKIKITPELTGKESQWGDLEELINLVKDFKGQNLGFCFDFAHKHARKGGGFNSKVEFDVMLEMIRDNLGQAFLSDMHIHVSGINYTAKGERNHLTLIGENANYEKEGIKIEGMEDFYPAMEKQKRIGPADLSWRELLQSLKEHNVGGIVVAESPNLEQEALLMKKVFSSL